MTENKKYCMGCMKEIDINLSVCPHCYYNSESIQHNPCLPKGSIISGRYLVGRAISIANDSITYIGLDKDTEEIVSVTEFFPYKIVSRANGSCEVAVKLGYDTMFRNCLSSFINLWRNIGSVKGEIALPEVRNILDFNGTVYAVCRYTDSITLKAYFEETRKTLPWQKAYSAFKGIFSALSKLHSKGVFHGNISPASVHVGSDGKLHLTSFSVSQCYSPLKELSAAPLSGFSPLEFYSENRSLSAASDVYSVMALIYYCITGIVPPKATERVVKDEMVIPSAVASSLPKRVISAFVKSLAVDTENRIQSIDELIRALSSDVQNTAVNTPKGKTVAGKNTAKTAPVRKASSDNSANQIKKKNKDTSLVGLAISTFAGVVVLCTVIFSILYTTILYKNYNVPVLNKVFSSFSFLPMNKENEDTTVNATVPTTEYVPQEKNYVTVPDFTAHTYDSIIGNDTFSRNFTFKFTFEYNDKYAKNAVISQDLTKGESVLAGTTVNIVVSRGAEQIELPEVMGLNYKDAESELKEIGFKVKIEYLENDGSHNEGIVEMTDKVAGLEFDLGTEIVLSVWDEPKEEETEEETTKKKKEDSGKKKEETTKKKKEKSDKNDE